MLLLNFIRAIIYMLGILAWALAMPHMGNSTIADAVGFLLGVGVFTVSMTLADVTQDWLVRKFNKT